MIDIKEATLNDLETICTIICLDGKSSTCLLSKSRVK